MARVYPTTPTEDLLSAMLWRRVKVDQAHEGILVGALEEMLATLPPRQARLLRLRFGLGGHSPHTEGEIGEVLGTTSQTISKHEAMILEKLRHPLRMQLLRQEFNLSLVNFRPKKPSGKRRRRLEPPL